MILHPMTQLTSPAQLPVRPPAPSKHPHHLFQPKPSSMPEIRPRERDPRDARSAASGERERDQGVLRERQGPAPRAVSASRGRAERREGRARVGMRRSDSPDEQASAHSACKGQRCRQRAGWIRQLLQLAARDPTAAPPISLILL